MVIPKWTSFKIWTIPAVDVYHRPPLREQRVESQRISRKKDVESRCFLEEIPQSEECAVRETPCLHHPSGREAPKLLFHISRLFRSSCHLYQPHSSMPKWFSASVSFGFSPLLSHSPTLLPVSLRRVSNRPSPSPFHPADLLPFSETLLWTLRRNHNVSHCCDPIKHWIKWVSLVKVS